jgi:hypothetical protein
MPKVSKGGSTYLATFLDDYIKLSVVQPLKKKSDVVAIIEGVLACLELQTGKKVKAVQTDRGGEYVNKEMTTLLSKRGITHRKTAGYSPEPNGSAERLNRDLQEKGRTMLEDLGLGEELWAEAMVTANYTCNRLPSRVHRKTPWEKFFGKKPGVSHMRVFGARAYMHIPKENKKKMQSVSERGVFVGYELDFKAYRVLRERDGRILVSRDVIIDEKPAFRTIELSSGLKKEEEGARGLSHVSPPTQMGTRDIPTGKSSTQLGAGDILTGKSSIGREESSGPLGVLTGGATASQKLLLQIDLQDKEDGEKQELRKNPAREKRILTRYWANLAIERSNPRGSGEHPEPQTYQEAISGEESELWQKSMDEEMRSLLENGTWELVERPEGVKPIPMKWVYKVKQDAQGNVERYKSRLVAKGFLQKQGVDFEEVYAPVSKHTTLRALLAIVA